MLARNLAVSLLATGLCFCNVYAQNVGHWPHFMGPNSTGAIAQSGVLDPQKIAPLWTAAVGTGFSSVAVVGDRLFTMGNADETDTVYCLSAADGSVVWRHSYPCKLIPLQYEGGPNTTPTWHEKKVYTLGKEGQLYCLAADNGSVVWSHDLREGGVQAPKFGLSGSPVVTGDIVLINAGSGGAAFHKDTGAVVWKSTPGEDDKCYATPALFTHESKVAAAFFVGDRLIAIDPATGKELWRVPWSTKYDVHPVAPVFFDNKMFVSAGNDKDCALYQLDANGPTLLWEKDTMSNQLLNSIYREGSLFGVDGSTGRRSSVVCLDAVTGDVRWSNPDTGYGSLIMVGDKLILLSENGVLFIAEARPDTYVELFRKEIIPFKCWTPPAVADGKLFVRNAAGDLVCLSLVASAE